MSRKHVNVLSMVLCFDLPLPFISSMVLYPYTHPYTSTPLPLIELVSTCCNGIGSEVVTLASDLVLQTVFPSTSDLALERHCP